MASSSDSVSMALFCDFENVALGVRDANYEKFDIKRVLERLLLKGSIVVKKAYCDWDRYKSFKASMHEANFELIEIPHVRQSGKNSADIRLVVDALDLCYTKSHVDTFVIISGDSDFSPLVSKLRENAKQVIGVGVKQSTSDLLIANCDEFIFYDDLVRESQRNARKEARETQASAKRSPEEEKRRREEVEARKAQAIEFAVQTFDALYAERGDSGKIWASVLKEAMKRRKPDFSESYYGFRAFGNLLEEARARGLLDFTRDEKGRTFVSRGHTEAVRIDAPNGRGSGETAEVLADSDAEAAMAEGTVDVAPREGGRKPAKEGRRRGRKTGEATSVAREPVASELAGGEALASQVEPGQVEHRAEAVTPGADEGIEAGMPSEAAAQAAAESGSGQKRKSATPRGGSARKRGRKSADEATAADHVTTAPTLEAATVSPTGAGAGDAERAQHHEPVSEPQPAVVAAVAEADAVAEKKPRKQASRGRRPRKQELPPDAVE
ncbi:NYN domain-containing protein [Thauera sp. 2A1]|uniref:NYN domain-containing protein n=1 Tax=Thauera sp. 2A1 TaxID=2570191 RepID=UPI0012912961|nr:NYN domain-containing protein [Thauera sp. 2A1]KAI5913499.1 NYN domain-containing protein [Thauera sp. 2A1]